MAIVHKIINLLIYGYATSQVHDGNIPMGDTGLSLNGVQNTPRIGYLTYLEALRYCADGEISETQEFLYGLLDRIRISLFYLQPIGWSRFTKEKHSKLLKRVFNKVDEWQLVVQTLQLQQILQELNLLQGNSDDKIEAL